MVELNRKFRFAFFNRTQGLSVAEEVEKADTFWSRGRGLLGRESLETGQGMWIVPCAMVHTCFMAFPIDVVFLDREQKVLRISPLKPWRASPWVRGAASVLELREGAAARIRPGDVLEVRRK